MNKAIFSFLLCALTLSLTAQSHEIDSLKASLHQHPQTDTVRIKRLNIIAYNSRYLASDTAIKYAMLADSLSDEINYRIGKLESLRIIANCYSSHHNFSEALVYYQQVLDLSQELGDVSSCSYCLNYMGNVYLMQGDYDLALNYYNKALSGFTDIDDEVGISGIYNNNGNIYYVKGDYPKALECFHKGLKVFENLDNKKGMSGSYNNIGVIYDEQSNYSKALEFYLKALDIRLGLDSKEDVADSYINIGNIYTYRDDYDLALDYYQKALAISQEIHDQAGVSFCYFNFGIVYSGQEEYVTSLEFFNKSMDIAEVFGLSNMIIANNVEFSKVYFYLEKYDRAIKFGEKGYRMAQQLSDPDNIKEASEILAKCYAKTANYQKAYHYHLEFKAQSDSLQNDANTEKIIGLEYKYKYEKEKELADIAQEKKEVALMAETKHQKTIRNSFIAGFSLVLLFAIFVFRSLAQNRKANRQLTLQKAEIGKQADELKMAHDTLLELNQFKEGMTSMIVHDLKNPLNGIINSSRTFSLERQVEYMKQVGRQMLTMVLNILDVNKYENSAMQLDKSSGSLLEIAQGAVDEITFLAKQKNISIQNEIDARISVLVDKDIIQRVFVNLLSNAIKYTPNNGHVIIAAENSLDKVIVTVQDSGEGIPADKLELVFAKFKQIAAKDSGRIRSTGLGLTFCKMAVEAHDGNIQALSDINQGAIFEFTLEAGKELTSRIDSKSCAPAAKAFELSADDKRVLAPLVLQLKEIEIYKMFEVRKIIRTIDEKDNVNIQHWKGEILSAVVSGNKEKYTQLLVL